MRVAFQAAEDDVSMGPLLKQMDAEIRKTKALKGLVFLVTK